MVSKIDERQIFGFSGAALFLGAEDELSLVCRNVGVAEMLVRATTLVANEARGGGFDDPGPIKLKDSAWHLIGPHEL